MSDDEKHAGTEKIQAHIKHASGEDNVIHNEYLHEILAWTPEQRADAERHLVRKIDRRLIPWMTLLYLMSFLDRECSIPIRLHDGRGWKKPE